MVFPPPDDELEASQESMTSPIVINDKMLSHASVAVPARFPLSSLLTPSDLEIYKAIQIGVTERQLENDPCSNFIDSDAIASILMDLNEQDFQVPCNEIFNVK